MSPIDEAAAEAPAADSIPTIQPPADEPPPVDNDHVADGAEQFADPLEVHPDTAAAAVQPVGDADPAAETQTAPVVESTDEAAGVAEASAVVNADSAANQRRSEAALAVAREDLLGTNGPLGAISAPLDGKTGAENEAELTRIAEEQRAKALQETEQQPVAQPIVAIPLMITGFYVRVRLAADREFDTEAMITRVNLAEGTLNVTAFPDGEVPRPIGNVPYHPNKPDASIAWRE